MDRRSLTCEQVLTLLEAAPLRLAVKTAEVTSGQLHTPAGPGEWTANEVLAHMRACADVWGNCIVTILAEDRPIVRAVNPRTWIKRTNYLEQDFRASLRAFTAQREELLRVLRPLRPEGWAQTAVVTGAGKPFERTVLIYAQRLARHEQPHVKQIEHIVSTVHG